MKKKINLPEKIRVRLAPSPTGPLHIGTARIALYNYLFAQQNKGDFLLRIEDTDKERSDQKWTGEIIEELHWLGINWLEGPDVGGEFGPYKQSQRTEIYQKYLEQLLTEKKAYYCNCNPEELEEKRQKQMALGQAPKYDSTCRDKNNTTGAVRFKVEHKKVKFNDLIRKEVEFDMGLLGDFVIAKNLENPLFHLVVVIDDFLMQISHVIRGEDHISNTPRQILLQEALGFHTPIYAHLPLFLSPGKKGKMSKRHGDVALKDFHTSGYLPEAIVNFIALLGWNPGTEKELFSMDELIKEFSLEKVQKSNAIFNIQRLDFINSHYINEKPISKLTELCLPFLTGLNTEQFTKHQLESIIALHQPRLKKLSDVSAMTDYFFQTPKYEATLLAWAKMSSGEVRASLTVCKKVLEAATAFDKNSLETLLVQEAKLFNLEKNYPLENKGYLLWPLRVALSGKSASAGPFEIAEILGKEKTLERIDRAITLVN